MSNFDLASSRYASAAGWEPEDKWAKLRAKAWKNMYVPDPPAFEVEGGNYLRSMQTAAPPARLFGDLWREGETALLFGGSGAGKSILAVQLAEAIARGPRNADKRRRRVIYIDLERTLDQFLHRYSFESHVHRFSPRFRRARFDDYLDVPEKYSRDVYRYFRSQVGGIITSRKADAVIIDSAEHLVPSLSRNAAGVRLLKQLKFHAMNGVAVLLVAHARTRRTDRPLTVDDILGGAEIADVADSVFAIGRSTMGEDIRYLKHLKSSTSQIRLDENRVAVYRLERRAHLQTPRGTLPDPALLPDREPQLPPADDTEGLTPPPPETGPAAIVRAILSNMRNVDGTPNGVRPPAGPAAFLGLTHLGFSTESVHRLDYAALEQKRVHEIKHINRPKSLTAGILDGTYARYLNGD